MERTHATEAVWLNDRELCSLDHLAEVSGLSLDELTDLIDNGVLVPADAGPPRRFRLTYVVTVKTARRLRDDFQLDRAGLALALTLLRRAEALQAQLDALQARAGRLK
jgi:chaperone modulatory protein CbpM